MSAFSFMDNLGITCSLNILKIKIKKLSNTKSFKSFSFIKQSKCRSKRK